MNNKGFLLTETCAALAIACVAGVILFNALAPLANAWQKMQADFVLYRAARYSYAFMAQELYLYADSVKITTGSSDRIVCGEIRGNRQVSFYRSSGYLYREIKYNSTRGVNPMSLEEVSLVSLKAQKLAADRLLVKLQLQHKASGRKKDFTEVFCFANGSF